MSSTLRGVALGLSVPLVLAMSGWAGWTALTSNLVPAESAHVDPSWDGPRDHQQPDANAAQLPVKPASNPGSSPSPELPSVSYASEPAPPLTSGAKGGVEVAPASVAKSALVPVTAGQAEPSAPKKPKIRFVRVPKSATDASRN